MKLTLELPDDLMADSVMSEPQKKRLLLLELACALYGKGVLSLGRAAELAGVSKIDLGKEVGERGISRHYSQTELAADLAYAGGQ
jgi:predicted HTH domain antitoxin